MSSIKIKIEKNWLHIPTGRLTERYYIKFEVGGKQIGLYRISLAHGTPDFYCAMNVSDYVGKEMVITPEDDLPAGMLEAIVQGDDILSEKELYPDIYKESLRPVYHFSPMRGWMNDPNGLLFDGDTYHMFFQHNPYGILHGNVNIQWGHAVSKDMLYWKELPDAITHDDCKVHVASGSAIKDNENKLGYGTDTIVAFYTKLGCENFRIKGERVFYPSEGQNLMYSIDGGLTFKAYENNPVIPTKDGLGWRDPRILLAPDGHYYIAVYETNERGNCVSFYKSDDLKNWTFMSQTDDLYECPDLFILDVEGKKGDKKWVLYGADGMARIGEFEKGCFTQTGERSFLDYGTCIYAGQTFNGLDDSEGRLHISWLRSDDLSWTEPSFDGMPFAQQMTVPCLLNIIESKNGLSVTRRPIEAVKELRSGNPETIELFGKTEYSLFYPCSDTELTIESDGPVEVKVGKYGFSYDPKKGEAVFDDGVKSREFVNGGALALRLFTDRMSCEMFLQNEISASYGMDMSQITIHISGKKEIKIAGKSYKMKNIWDGI